MRDPSRPARSPSSGETPGSDASRPRAPRGSLPILFVTVFLDLVGFGIVIPLLPLYAERFGAGAVAAASLLAVFSLMQFLFAPAWGTLSDRIGRRPVLLIGLFGSALSYLAFGLAGSLGALFAARALGGAMGANIGVAQAYIGDVSLPEERTRGMGVIGAAFGLGFILGPAIGGVLVPYGAAVPFLAAAALCLLNGLVALVRLPESLPPEARTGRAPRAAGGPRLRSLRLGRQVAAMKEALTGSRLGRLHGAGFLLTLALAGMEAVFALWGSRRWGYSPAEVAYLFAYLGVIGAVVQGGLVGRLARRFGERRVVLAGSALLGTGLVIVPLSPTPALLAAALAVFALGRGLSTPPLFALVSREAGADAQGVTLGAQQSLSALGRVLGPVLGGLLFAYVGIAAPYFAGALVTGLALLLVAGLPAPEAG